MPGASLHFAEITLLLHKLQGETASRQTASSASQAPVLAKATGRGLKSAPMRGVPHTSALSPWVDSNEKREFPRLSLSANFGISFWGDAGLGTRWMTRSPAAGQNQQAQEANPNAARCSDHMQEIPCSNRLTVKDRGCRPSTMASRMSGAR